MLTLYHFHNSVCSQKVRIVLFEKDLQWENKEVNLFTNAQYEKEYLKLNPKGFVPTLIHENKTIRESTLICEYLNEVFLQPPLAPSTPVDRAEMRLWSKTVDEGLYEGVVVFSFSAMFRERMQKQSPERREQRYRNVGDPTRRDRFKSTFEEGVESPYVFRGIAAYETACKTMEQVLSDGRLWLVGDLFSLAEINLAPFFARLEYLQILGHWTEDRPLVQAWWQRVKNRDSYQAEIVDKLSKDDIQEMSRSGFQISQRVGERLQDYLDFLE